MKEIGGYFELELRKGLEYHSNAIALNTGRNALELILLNKKIAKVYIPYYTCDVILEPIEKCKIDFEYYHINECFEPIFDYSKIKENEGFLYNNYFGIKDEFIFSLSTQCNNLIIDNTQSFFSKPINNIPTFYSCRKFFGVSDGSYLYLDGINSLNIPTDISQIRYAYLFKRIDINATNGYPDFEKNEKSLIGQPIMFMSKTTKALLSNIDYEEVKRKRRENFLFLDNSLSKYNKLNFKFGHESVPMIYPFFYNNGEVLKQKLIENNVYVPTYWPNVFEWLEPSSIEFQFAKQILFLPIDQRYSEIEMKLIAEIIKENL